MWVDREKLAGMSSQFTNSTKGLDDVASSAPPMPRVSTSADKVGHTLGVIAEAVAGTMGSVKHTASQIDASDGSYGDAENKATTELKDAYLRGDFPGEPTGFAGWGMGFSR